MFKTGQIIRPKCNRNVEFKIGKIERHTKTATHAAYQARNVGDDEWNNYPSGMFEFCDYEVVAEKKEEKKTKKCVPAKGEPSFTLLGRDPVAPLVIRFWRDLRHACGLDFNGTEQELYDLYMKMADHAIGLGKAAIIDRALSETRRIHIAEALKGL